MELFRRLRPYFSRRIHPVPGDARTRIFVPDSHSGALAGQAFSRWSELLSGPDLEREVSDLRRRRLFLDRPFHVEGRLVLAKAYVYHDFPRKIEGMFFFSDAQRNFFTLSYLHAHGIPVSKPLGLVQQYSGPVLSRAYLFLEKLPASAVDYKVFLHWLDRQDKAVRVRFFSDLGAQLAAVHKLGVFTKDMDKNVMVVREGGDFLFYFLDFDSVYPWRIPNRRRTFVSLKKFITPHHRWPEEDLRLFYSTYFSSRGKPEWEEGALSYVRTYIRENRERYP